MDEDQVEESPLSPDSLALVLSNIFRKESNGEPMEFYFRKARIFGRDDNKDFVNRLEILKTEIERCGGCLAEGPLSGHSVELAFPELFPDVDEVDDEDLFKVEFVHQCVEQREFLNLEDFRIGKSPYDGSIKIHDIIHGHQSWNSVHRTGSPHPEGRKLPDFGPKLESSLMQVKKKRCEYTRLKDVEILKYLVKHKLHSKVGGMEVWREVEKNLFPNEHTFQSLQTHFRKSILPNLCQFKEITENDRKLFGSVASVPSTSFSVRSLAPLRGNSSKAVEVGSKTRIENFSNTDDVENQESVGLGCTATNSTQNDVEMKESENILLTVQELPSHQIDRVENMETEKTESDASLSPRLLLKHTSHYFVQPKKHDSKPAESVTLSSNKHSIPNEAQRNIYTVEVDKLIIEFICAHEKFSETHEKKLWINIQDHIGENKQDWESTKDHFEMKILPSIDSEKYALKAEIIRSFRNRCKPSNPVSEEVTSISDENTDVESEEENIASSRLSVKSKVQKGLKKKSAGKPYTQKEDERIINFIRKEERFDEVRGKRLWLDMAEGKNFDRTWQSLKNRFNKTIVLNLKSYITDPKLIKKFMAGKESERNLGGRRPEPKHEKSKREKKPLRITEHSPKNETDEGDDLEPHEGPSKETVGTKLPTPPSKPKTPSKHPALAVTQKTPVKQNRVKLYKHPEVLATFTPRSSPIAIPKEQKAVPVAIVQSTRSPLAPLTRLSIDSVKYQDEHLSILLEDTDSAESNVKSCDDQLSIKEMVKKYSTPKTRPCSVLLQRLPQAELKKFGL